MTPIHRIQGDGLRSPFAGKTVKTRGVVVGHTRKGFFLQDPDGGADGCSCGLFVYARRDRPPLNALVVVDGVVVDFLAEAEDRPTTQLHVRGIRVVDRKGPEIEPTWIDADFLDGDDATIAARLNRLEGMRVGLPTGSTFIAPSNIFGDYVVLPPGMDVARARNGGVMIDPERPLRWYPSFRVWKYDLAPRVDVGAQLQAPVIGALNYRAQAYQIAVTERPKVQAARAYRTVRTLKGASTALTIMTLNGFNLDPHVEDRRKVNDPRRDVDDDVGEGRYDMLAEAIVDGAGSPDLVALQEIQDDDGAEISDVVTAEKNYATIIAAIRRAGGVTYDWIDVPPEAGADGGQPGGNIRNAFLFRPDRVELDRDSVRRMGLDDEAFVDSRKALLARFTLKECGASIHLVNVHLASKRHQLPLFAPTNPGLDPREDQRIAQARLIRETLQEIDGDVYVTGDFNDYEFSRTLRALCGEHFVNLVHELPADDRFDYNHRGTSQALMHGIVRATQFDQGRTAYEILHGNESVGATPGERGDRPTDHAYVLARLTLC